jgi:hypothetical protein
VKYRLDDDEPYEFLRKIRLSLRGLGGANLGICYFDFGDARARRSILATRSSSAGPKAGRVGHAVNPEAARRGTGATDGDRRGEGQAGSDGASCFVHHWP